MMSCRPTTDASGNFLFTNPPTGMQVLLVSGPTDRYPGSLPVQMTIQAGQANALSFIPYLHVQKTMGMVDISNSAVERLVTDPELPGFQMKIPADG